MGRILFRQFYTTFVEQCFHVVIRKWAHTGLPRKWYEFSTNWIAGLSEEDGAFIRLCLVRIFTALPKGCPVTTPVKITESSENDCTSLNAALLSLVA